MICHEKEKVRSTTTGGLFTIPGAYKVGGRRVSEPTSSARDNSLEIVYGPGDCGSCREAQTARSDIEALCRFRQRCFLKTISWPEYRRDH